MKKPILLALLPAAALVVGLLAYAALSGGGARWPETGRDTDLLRDRAFLEARTAISLEAGIGLVIDPSTPSALLVHGAVPLRAVAIERMHVSESIRHGKPDEPVLGHVIGRRGVLEKDPINRVEAPPDTTAVDPPPTKPQDADPAFGTIELDNGIMIMLLPSDETGWNRVRGFAFRSAEYGREIGRVVGAIVRGRAPVGRRRITLRLPDGDARAIFRALDDGAMVAVRTGRLADG